MANAMVPWVRARDAVNIYYTSFVGFITRELYRP